jgi:hypothetical protein
MHCVVHGLNLSYECLTSFEVQECLCKMKDMDPEFWKELTMKKQDLPSPDEKMPKDILVIDAGGDDNSDLPIQTVVTSVVNSDYPVGVAY